MEKKNFRIPFPFSFYGMEELGAVIKKRRQSKGWTQYEMGIRINCSVKFISNVEQGKETAEVGKILMILRFLNLGTQLVDLE